MILEFKGKKIDFFLFINFEGYGKCMMLFNYVNIYLLIGFILIDILFC